MTSSRDARKDFLDSSRGPDEILRLRLYYRVKSIVEVKKKEKDNMTNTSQDEV